MCDVIRVHGDRGPPAPWGLKRSGHDHYLFPVPPALVVAVLATARVDTVGVAVDLPFCVRPVAYSWGVPLRVYGRGLRGQPV